MRLYSPFIALIFGILLGAFWTYYLTAPGTTKPTIIVQQVSTVSTPLGTAVVVKTKRGKQYVRLDNRWLPSVPSGFSQRVRQFVLKAVIRDNAKQ